MNKKIVFIGASGHGKVVADLAKHSGYTEILFLDDNPDAKNCGAYPVVGQSKDAALYTDCDFFVSIGNAKVRRAKQEALEALSLRVVTLVHPNATVAESATLGAGCAVMAGAVINPDTVIGKGCIINTCASVDHDCAIGGFAHVSVGAHVAGTVTVGENTWIGAGATVSNNLVITSDCMIGAGAVVVKDLQESGTYVGVPAKKLERESAAWL